MTTMKRYKRLNRKSRGKHRLLRSTLRVIRNVCYLPIHVGKFKKLNPSKEDQVRFKKFNLDIVIWNDFYRFKHIGTGKYLALSNDKLELALKDYADFFDTLFLVRNESYRPNGPMSGESVKTKDHIILESF